MHYSSKLSLIVLLILTASITATADAVTDWNTKACEIVSDAGLATPPANRVMAIMHTAMYEAANAITKRYPTSGLKIDAASGASIDAAIAAASRTTLLKLVPSQQAKIESIYQAVLAKIGDGQPKTDGLVVGVKAAEIVMSMRSADGAMVGETYRPYTIAGVYVPTIIPAVPQWPQRKPWLMTSASQFRPGPPPKLTSELWARDYNEVKTFGGKDSLRRSNEQTEIARFWEATGPAIYHGIVRSVADMPGRDVTNNARLFMAVTQATDDAMVAVFDAKYHYNFWRPITAIRNGDIDGNDATEREAAWRPFIETPMHPEYPCAHCIVSGAVGTVLQAEIGNGTMPTLKTSSPTANGAIHSWPKVEDFMQEVANGRIYDGVHYRNSTEVGTAMGRQIGELAAAKYVKPIR
ncbi:MAG: vanadium-dependent haloperoxidase [Acidobacteria bacterium]|nr:vanadium-dependent haloperoxidase [Acidobacteriota bacterium]